MNIEKWWGKFQSKLPAGINATKDLVTWLFGAFLLPLVQLFFILFSTNTKTVDEQVYKVLFVAIASFLTSIFFVTNFWQQNRRLIRIMLLISYIISLGLFITSLVYEMFNTKIFNLEIYQWGAIIASILAILVGFSCKYDDKLDTSREIAREAKNKTQGSVNGNVIKV